jgi:deferrochelatase/peroxidase EfeB
LQNTADITARFGFLDGVSQPAVKAVDNSPDPGQETVEQGVFISGRELDLGVNDPANVFKTPAVPPLEPVTRREWAKDGSFLAFRYLKQRVPEFNKFMKQNALPVPPTTDPKHPNPTGADLLAARLVGRWEKW